MLTLQVAPDIAPPGINRSSTCERQFSSPVQQQVWIILSRLVHDMRQPLSVLEVCADYLNLILPADQLRAREQVEVLRQQVGEANRILCEALVLLKLGYEQAPPEAAAPAATARPLANAESAAVPY